MKKFEDKLVDASLDIRCPPKYQNMMIIASNRIKELKKEVEQLKNELKKLK